MKFHFAMRLIGAIVMVACAGVLLMFLLAGGTRKRTHMSVSLECVGDLPKQEERIPWSDMDVDPPNQTATASEREELVSAYRNLHIAYTNGDVNAMQDCMSRMPSTVSNVLARILSVAEEDFYESVWSTFLIPTNLVEFANVEDVRRYFRVNLLAVRFLGDTDLSRRTYSGLISMERRVLKKLNCYKEKFHNERRADMEACVDSSLAQWIEHIESERGYTRMYMRGQVTLQYGHVLKDGWSQERLLDAIRRYADGLIKAGYTPKWLDEEFPAAPAPQN